MTYASNSTPVAPSVALRPMVKILAERRRGMTAAEIGNAMWAKRTQGDLAPARYARAAGAMLHRAMKLGLVYRCHEIAAKRNVWHARDFNAESSDSRP